MRWMLAVVLATLVAAVAIGRTTEPTATARATAPEPTPSAQTAAGCGLDRFSGGVPASCWRPFSDRSFLNRPLPRRTKVLRTSKRIVRGMMSWGAKDVRSLYPVTRQGDDYYHPYVFSKRGDPVYTIHCTRDCGVAGNSPEGQSVRIPCGARQATGVDRHLAVIDREAGVEWDFFDLRTDLSDCKGGRLTTGIAAKIPLDGDGRLSCANAVCVGLTGGIIRYPELASGRIDHALFMVSGTCNGRTVFPGLSHNVCGHHVDHQPAVGQWFKLDLTPGQIARLPVRPWQKTILRAMARYGAFVGDQGSNGGFELQTESPETYRAIGRQNPWHAWARRQAARGDETVYATGETVTLQFGAGLPRSFWERHLRAVAACSIERSC